MPKSTRWLLPAFAIVAAATCTVIACSSEGADDETRTSDDGGNTTADGSSSGNTMADGSSGGADTGASDDDDDDAGDAGHADAADADASGGDCNIEDGTYLIHFTSATGTPPAVCNNKPADTTRTINKSDANFDAGANCTATYDFVNCTQKLVCLQTYSGGPIGTITNKVDSLSTWTPTQITGTLRNTIEASAGASDCTFEFTMTKQ